MGTLRGFPNPPATGSGEQSSPAPTRSGSLAVPSLRSGAHISVFAPLRRRARRSRGVGRVGSPSLVASASPSGRLVGRVTEANVTGTIQAGRSNSGERRGGPVGERRSVDARRESSSAQMPGRTALETVRSPMTTFTGNAVAQSKRPPRHWESDTSWCRRPTCPTDNQHPLGFPVQHQLCSCRSHPSTHR
jgi:hypothetical protein